MDTDALSALMASTTARIGVGRAGTRPRIESLLLFQSDFAVSQDALYKEVNPEIINKTGLFSVNTTGHRWKNWNICYDRTWGDHFSKEDPYCRNQSSASKTRIYKYVLGMD